MATWKELFQDAFVQTKDKWDDLKTTFKNGEENTDFNPGYGRENGCHFTAWSKDYVYFPICYDGSEWVGHVARNPCDIKHEHQGGG